MLKKYNSNTVKSITTDIKILLEQNKFIENKDFNLLNVEEIKKK